MVDHPLKKLIQDADTAITIKDFEGLMRFYADDAALVVKQGMIATGKEQLLKAFHEISEFFDNGLKVRRGKMEVIEGSDTALVIMETILEYSTPEGYQIDATRRGTYVFRKSSAGEWLCVIDNSYGTALLDD